MNLKMTWPMEKLTDRERGYIEGLTAFAWWKDGVQYVGTCGTTLNQAIDSYLTDAGYIKLPQVMAAPPLT